MAGLWRDSDEEVVAVGVDKLESSASDSGAWADPSLTCDIVMKGGITSGVVYPGAVVELAKRYRFKSIGGASAGAIAAAAVAAAEYGRTQGGGFARLARVPDELSATDAGGKGFLLQLFNPEDSTRRLFDTGFGFLRGESVATKLLNGVSQLLRSFFVGPLVASALVVVALLLGVFGVVPWWLARSEERRVGKEC